MLVSTKLPTSQQERAHQLPIQLFDTHAPRPPVQLGGVPSDLTGAGTMTFSPNGRWLSVLLEPVSGGSGQVVGVWDTRRPGSDPVALLHPGTDVWKSVVSSDGRTLYAGEPGVVEVIDVARDQIRATIDGPRAGVGPLTEQMRISPDGKTLAVGAGSEIALLETATLAPKARLTAQGDLAQVAFSGDGRRLAAVDSGLVVWDIAQATPTQLFRGNRWGGEHIELSPDGQTLYSFGQNSVQSWDVEGNAGFLTALPSPPTSSTGIGQEARVSPDGRRIAYTYYRGPGFGIEVRDVQSGRLAPLIKNDQEFGGYEDMDWRPDGLAVTTIVGGPIVRTWDVRSGELISARYVGSARTASVEYTTDGFLLVGTDEGSVHVLTLPSLRPRGSPIKILDEAIIGLDANPKDHTVFVQGTSTRLLLDYLTGTNQRVTDLAGEFSPDGLRFAVLDASGAVGLKRTDTMSWIAKPDPSRPLGGKRLEFSRDGAWLAASSTNGKVGLWNGRTGAFAGSAQLEGEVVVGFSEDSSTMVIASSDGSAVKTWDPHSQSWVNAACRTAGRNFTTAEWQSSFPDRPYQDVCPSTS
jgi:WD40 repeat protein